MTMHNPVLFAASAAITRPGNTTQYTSGDLIANSATASECVALSFALAGRGRVRRASIHSTHPTVTNFDVRLHLFTVDPFSTDPSNGDNGAIELNAGNGAGEYLGYIDFAESTIADIFASDKVQHGAPAIGTEIGYDLSGKMYGVLEARDTYTPANAEVLTVELEVEPD